MKKTIKTMFAIVAGALLLAGCAKEEALEGNVGKMKIMTFVANQELTAGTKAEIDGADSKKIDWSANDKISVLDGTNNNSFRITAGEGSTQASFTGTAASAAQYTAIYPYQSGITLDGGLAKGVVLPEVQTATPGSFDPAAGLMMAVSNAEGELAFKNCVCYIKVTAPEAVKSIRFSSLSAVAIAGEMSLAYNAGAPVATVTGKPAVSVALVPKDGDTTIPAGTYYIAVLPQALEDGFKISYVDTDGNGHIRISWNSYTTVRNKVVNMGNLDPATYIYNNRQVIYQASEKYSPNSSMAINGYNPINQTSSFTHTFEGNIGVLTYKEDITSAYYLFYNNAPTVTKVVLPETISVIRDFCLKQTQVKTISIPSSVRELDYAFAGSNLETIIFPEGIENMDAPLMECTKVREVNIPSTVTDFTQVGAFGVKRFYGKWASEDGTCVIKDNCMTDFATGNTLITDVTVPNTVTSLGACCFYGANLNSVTIPSSITALPASCFGRANINTVNLPNTLTTIGYSCFQYMTCPLIEIPASVTTLKSQIMAWSNIGEVRFASGSQLVNVPSRAFYQTYVRIPIPQGVETIGSQSYFCYSNKLQKTDIIIPDNVTTIGEAAFMSSENIESVILGKNVSSIAKQAFAYIGKSTKFYHTENGVSVKSDVPEDQQTNLKSLTSKNPTPPTLGTKVFDGTSLDASFKIYVPAASVDAYKAADGWKDYASYIEAMPKPNLLTGEFSVSATKKVKFTKSNLYWNGSAFAFEANQSDHPTTWSSSHVGHFFWTNGADYDSGTASYMPYASSYSYSNQSTSDAFWCGEAHKLTVAGTTDLYTLSNAEWNYLICTRSQTNCYAYAKVNDQCGLLIFPDRYQEGTEITSITGIAPVNTTLLSFNELSGSIPSGTWSSMESDGVVFLPFNGNYDSSNVVYTNNGYYWTSTPDSNTWFVGNSYAFCIYNNDAMSFGNTFDRGRGLAIRLVKTVE